MGPKKSRLSLNPPKNKQSSWHEKRSEKREKGRIEKEKQKAHESEIQQVPENVGVEESCGSGLDPPVEYPDTSQDLKMDTFEERFLDCGTQVGVAFSAMSDSDMQFGVAFSDFTENGAQVGAVFADLTHSGTQVTMHVDSFEKGVQVGAAFSEMAEAETQIVEMETDEIELPQKYSITIGPNSFLVDPELLTSKDLNFIASQLALIVPANWTVAIYGTTMYLNFTSFVDKTPKILKCISWDGSELCIRVHGQNLLNNHLIWDVWSASGIFVIDLLKVLTAVNNLSICPGSVLEECKNVWQQGVFAVRGFIDCGFSPNPCYRSRSCALLTEKKICISCRCEQNSMVRIHRKQAKRASLEGRDISKINIKYLAKPELAAALVESRKMGTKCRREIRFLKAKLNSLIEERGQEIEKELSDDFININKKNIDKMSDIQKLFWDQQLKMASLKSKSSMKWHPMMIRMALHFHMCSPANYDAMRRSRFISLPSQRTLFEYSHSISPQEGCQAEVLSDLSEQVSKLECEYEKYGVLFFDEMHIRSNLIYSKQTGKMVGYSNLTELETEFQLLEAEITGAKPTRSVAKKVLVFMFRNLAGNTPEKTVKMVVAVYSVSELSASALNDRVWEVIYHIEAAGVPVLVLTCDGASTNRRFVNMQFQEVEGDLIYCTPNLASPILRLLYFLFDEAHLLKTSRNCFANSYYHKKSRKLWNKEVISWGLVVDHFLRHKSQKLRKAHALTASHVYLTSFSCMKVSLAAQVMSATLAAAIESDAKAANEKGQTLPWPYVEAVRFMRLVNDVFDCLNGNTTTSHIRFNNANLAPYSSLNDSRFDTLRDFVTYLDGWEKTVRNRPGNFSKTERTKMMLSPQTVSGHKVTITSFISIVKFLINEGATEFCARRLSQDSLEQYFSTLRRKGGSSNNPDVYDVLQTRVSLHAQKQVALPSMSGNTKVEEEAIQIDCTPVKKRKK